MIRVMGWISLAGCKGLGFWNGLGARNWELLGGLTARGVSGCLGSLYLVVGRLAVSFERILLFGKFVMSVVLVQHPRKGVGACFTICGGVFIILYFSFDTTKLLILQHFIILLRSQ